MNILRKMGVSLCATILSVVLLGLAWSSVGTATIRNRSVVKGWLDKSNFYSQVVDVVLEKAKGSSGKSETDIPVNDPGVQAAAKQAFSPDFLRKNVEAVLDSGYAWADGSKNNIDFSIDLTAAKQQLATGLGDYAKNKAAALPICNPAEITQDFDSFKATCRPAAVSPEQAGAKVTADLLTNKDFLAKPVFTSEDLKAKDDSGGTQAVPIENTNQAKAARKAYQLSGYVPMALAITALITGLGVIFLSADHYRGLRRAGWTLFTSGMVLLVTYAVLVIGASMIDRKVAETAQNKLISDVAKVVVRDIEKALLPYVIGLVGGGTVMVITGGKLAKRRDNTNKREFDEHKDMLPEPATPADNRKEDQVNPLEESRNDK